MHTAHYVPGPSLSGCQECFHLLSQVGTTTAGLVANFQPSVGRPRRSAGRALMALPLRHQAHVLMLQCAMPAYAAHKAAAAAAALLRDA